METCVKHTYICLDKLMCKTCMSGSKGQLHVNVYSVAVKWVGYLA